MRAIVGRRDDRKVRGSVHVEAGVARRHFLNYGQTGFTTIQAHAHRSGGIDCLGWAGIGDCRSAAKRPGIRHHRRRGQHRQPTPAHRIRPRRTRPLPRLAISLAHTAFDRGLAGLNPAARCLAGHWRIAKARPSPAPAARLQRTSLRYHQGYRCSTRPAKMPTRHLRALGIDSADRQPPRPGGG